MCVVCPVVGCAILLGSMVFKSLKKTPPEPKPKPLPLAVYGEDLDD